MVDYSILCPVETTLYLIENKWKVLILRDLLDGTKRFGELKKAVGNISQKVLTANLREMEDAGLLVRKVYAEVPPRVEYTLTELGESLRSVLDAMVEWGNNYKKHHKSFLNLYTENRIAYTRNRTVLIHDLPSLRTFVTTVREESETPVDTVVVDETNVSESFFDFMEDANTFLMGEKLKLVVDKKQSMNSVDRSFSNLTFQQLADEVYG